MILKRRIVPTGEPDNTERVPSGSVGGWGKRSISDLARSLPNLRSRFRQRLRRSVRLPEQDDGRHEMDARRRLCGTALSDVA